MSSSVFSHPKTLALSAMPLNVAFSVDNLQEWAAERVSPDAMSFGCIPCLKGIAAERIHFWSDSSQVVYANTGAVSASVVNLKSFRDFSVDVLENPSASSEVLPNAFCPSGDIEEPVSISIEGASPFKAIVPKVHFGQEAVNWRDWNFPTWHDFMLTQPQEE